MLTSLVVLKTLLRLQKMSTSKSPASFHPKILSCMLWCSSTWFTDALLPVTLTIPIKNAKKGAHEGSKRKLHSMREATLTCAEDLVAEHAPTVNRTRLYMDAGMLV